MTQSFPGGSSTTRLNRPGPTAGDISYDAARPRAVQALCRNGRPDQRAARADEHLFLDAEYHGSSDSSRPWRDFSSGHVQRRGSWPFRSLSHTRRVFRLVLPRPQLPASERREIPGRGCSRRAAARLTVLARRMVGAGVRGRDPRKYWPLVSHRAVDSQSCSRSSTLAGFIAILLL